MNMWTVFPNKIRCLMYTILTNMNLIFRDLPPHFWQAWREKRSFWEYFSKFPRWRIRYWGGWISALFSWCVNIPIIRIVFPNLLILCVARNYSSDYTLIMKNVRLRSPDSLGSSELNNLGEKFPVNNHNIWQQLVSTLLSLHPVTTNTRTCEPWVLSSEISLVAGPGPIPWVSSVSSAQSWHCHIVFEEVL